MIETYSKTLIREYGSPLCDITAQANVVHPVAIRFGGATVVLSKHDALAMAHALVDAVCSLPKNK